jgi:hypothetical protein
VVFLNGVSYAHELGYRTIVEDWERSGAYPVRYLPTVSWPADPRNAGWSGRTGRVEAILEGTLEELGLSPANSIAYICGNPDMILAAEETLLGRGYPEDQVHKELYWPKGKEPRGLAGVARVDSRGDRGRRGERHQERSLYQARMILTTIIWLSRSGGRGSAWPPIRRGVAVGAALALGPPVRSSVTRQLQCHRPERATGEIVHRCPAVGPRLETAPWACMSCAYEVPRSSPPTSASALRTGHRRTARHLEWGGFSPRSWRRANNHTATGAGDRGGITATRARRAERYSPPAPASAASELWSRHWRSEGPPAGASPSRRH